MHELSIAQYLFDFCKTIEQQYKPKEITKINLSVNPLSCLNEDILGFLLKNIAESEKNIALQNVKIHIEKNNSPDSREITVKDIEIEE
ncbi:MAG: hydrogenase/urease maturation nickel metallochaperone HypA [Candidatus Omnitrophica bacterium]|jgi:Zn finger protein HypA/HybF involved in hydrogenase expression|nr:hydrogenase/urease maturation nickel metallochaperone HypA [Candidatus Omnitrophota bacterium]